MAQVLLLTRALTPSSSVLPGLELLSHQIKVMSPEPTALITAPSADLILIDGRSDLPAVRSLCKLMETTGNTSPVILITTEGGLDIVGQRKSLAGTIRRLRDAGITVSAFVDAELAQIKAAADLGVQVCEIHTGP